MDCVVDELVEEAVVDVNGGTGVVEVLEPGAATATVVLVAFTKPTDAPRGIGVVVVTVPLSSTSPVTLTADEAGVVDVAFCNPSVFQMLGPTELNHGGRGLAVDDVGVAITTQVSLIIPSIKKKKIDKRSELRTHLERIDSGLQGI